MPSIAYVDDVWSHKAFLEQFPSIKYILADITHLMRRYSDTLVSRHAAAGTTLLPDDGNSLMQIMSMIIDGGWALLVLCMQFVIAHYRPF